MESDFHSFFRRRFLPIFFDVGSILGGFGRPIWRPKSIFGRFFFDVFSERVLASIFGCFLKARKLENSGFPLGKLQFSQNRRFRKICEKSSILDPFWEAKTTKNREKTMLKNMLFLNIDFLHFSVPFWRPFDQGWDLWVPFGRPGGSFWSPGYHFGDHF